MGRQHQIPLAAQCEIALLYRSAQLKLRWGRESIQDCAADLVQHRCQQCCASSSSPAKSLPKLAYLVTDLRFLLHFLPLTRTGILANSVQRAGFVPVFWSPNTVFNQLFDVSWTNYTHINRKCKGQIILVNMGKQVFNVDHLFIKPQVNDRFYPLITSKINQIILPIHMISITYPCG